MWALRHNPLSWTQRLLCTLHEGVLTSRVQSTTVPQCSFQAHTCINSSCFKLHNSPSFFSVNVIFIHYIQMYDTCIQASPEIEEKISGLTHRWKSNMLTNSPPFFIVCSFSCKRRREWGPGSPPEATLLAWESCCHCCGSCFWWCGFTQGLPFQAPSGCMWYSTTPVHESLKGLSNPNLGESINIQAHL